MIASALIAFIIGVVTGTTLRSRKTELKELIQELTPTVEFYLKREINSPSNHQEFAREASERLDRWHELTRMLRAERDGK